jgi:hypothetical protein
MARFRIAGEIPAKTGESAVCNGHRIRIRSVEMEYATQTSSMNGGAPVKTRIPWQAEIGIFESYPKLEKSPSSYWLRNSVSDGMSTMIFALVNRERLQASLAPDGSGNRTDFPNFLCSSDRQFSFDLRARDNDLGKPIWAGDLEWLGGANIVALAIDSPGIVDFEFEIEGFEMPAAHDSAK